VRSSGILPAPAGAVPTHAESLDARML